MTAADARELEGLETLLWDSCSMVVAIIGSDLRIVEVSPHLAATVGRDLAGEPATMLVARGQAQVLTRALSSAGAAWSDMVLGLAMGEADLPLDYRIRIATRDGRILLVGEPSHTDTSMVEEQLLVVTEDLISEQRRISLDRDRLDRLTTTDPLTNVGNRRRLEAHLAQRVAATAMGEALAVVFVDIDHFKAVNDEHGHAAGDEVLRSVSDLLVATCRGDDLVTRYGGEEFVAVLPRTTLQGAVKWAERARSTLEASRQPRLGRAVTASFGVAEHRHGESADILLARADAALLAAKAAGRNRVAEALQQEGGGYDVVVPLPSATSPGAERAQRLSEVLWQSTGMGVAEFDHEGRLLGANEAFRNVLGEGLEGRSLTELVAWNQAPAVTRFINEAGPDWIRGAFGLATDPVGVPLDRVLWLRRSESGLDLLVDVDPALPEQTAGPLMGMVDDLVATQRELRRTNERLERTLAALEAASLEVGRLREIVPMCAWCRRIRVDGPADPEWLSTEAFLARDRVDVTHAICEDCLARVEHSGPG